jgi:hypothetical protein
VLGLAVGDPADVDVEHVDLSVRGLDLALGADQDRRVRGLVLPGHASGDAPCEEVDPELARPCPGGRDRRPVQRLGSGLEGVPRSEQVPLLGQRHQLGAVVRGGAHEALCGLEVPLLVVR